MHVVKEGNAKFTIGKKGKLILLIRGVMADTIQASKMNIEDAEPEFTKIAAKAVINIRKIYARTSTK